MAQTAQGRTYKVTICDENSTVLNIIEIDIFDLGSRRLAQSIGDEIVDEINRAENRRIEESGE